MTTPSKATQQFEDAFSVLCRRVRYTAVTHHYFVMTYVSVIEDEDSKLQPLFKDSNELTYDINTYEAKLKIKEQIAADRVQCH